MPDERIQPSTEQRHCVVFDECGEMARGGLSRVGDTGYRGTQWRVVPATAMATTAANAAAATTSSTNTARTTTAAAAASPHRSTHATPISEQPDAQLSAMQRLSSQQTVQAKMAGAGAQPNMVPMARPQQLPLQRGPNDPPLTKPMPEQPRASQLLVQKWREEAMAKTSELPRVLLLVKSFVLTLTLQAIISWPRVCPSRRGPRI